MKDIRRGEWGCEVILHVAPNGEQNERIIIDNIPVTSQVIRGSLQHVCLSISPSNCPSVRLPGRHLSVDRSVCLSSIQCTKSTIIFGLSLKKWAKKLKSGGIKDRWKWIFLFRVMVADIILARDSQIHINQQSEVTFRSLFVNSPPSKGACGWLNAVKKMKDTS